FKDWVEAKKEGAVEDRNKILSKYGPEWYPSLFELHAVAGRLGWLEKELTIDGDVPAGLKAWMDKKGDMKSYRDGVLTNHGFPYKPGFLEGEESIRKNAKALNQRVFDSVKESTDKKLTTLFEKWYPGHKEAHEVYSAYLTHRGATDALESSQRHVTIKVKEL